MIQPSESSQQSQPLQESQPSVVFVRGCARSGTTLLCDIINESPEIGVLVEQPLGDLAARLLSVFWYEEHLEKERAIIAAASNGHDSRKPAKPAVHFAPLENLDRVRFPRRYPTRERLPSILAAIVEASLEKSRLKLIGSKTPGHWDHFEFDIVRSMFPAVKDVFIVRNPLDTVNSIINRRNAARVGRDVWADKPVTEAIARFQEAICLLLSRAATYADGCYVVCYEDLVADPQSVLAPLGAFLGSELRDETGLVKGARAVKNVLTPSEEALVRDELGPAIDAWSTKKLTGRASSVVPQLADCVRVVKIGTTYPCDAPVGDRGLLGAGWSGAEPPGIWSDAPQADMFFAVPRDGEYHIALDFAGYVPKRREPLEVAITIAGRRSDLTLRSGRRTRLRFGPFSLGAGQAHQVSFNFSQLRSPLERGLGTDRRLLGICLRSFTVERATRA
jgi:hypothetical protein